MTWYPWKLRGCKDAWKYLKNHGVMLKYSLTWKSSQQTQFWVVCHSHQLVSKVPSGSWSSVPWFPSGKRCPHSSTDLKQNRYYKIPIYHIFSWLTINSLYGNYVYSQDSAPTHTAKMVLKFCKIMIYGQQISGPSSV